MRLLIDGVVFQERTSVFSQIWRGLLPRLADNTDVVLLDRGNAPEIPGARLVPFPSRIGVHTAANSLLLEDFCTHFHADLFLSTFYSTPMRTPSLVLVYDMVPELLDADSRSRRGQEKELAILYARRRICLSERTLSDLEFVFKGLNPDSLSVVACEIDVSIFRPRSDAEVSDFRKAHGLENPYFLWVAELDTAAAPNRLQAFVDGLGLAGNAADIVVVGDAGHFASAGNPPEERLRYLTLANPNLARALSAAEGLVLPAPTEGFDLWVAEANACGCRVFAPRETALVDRNDSVIFIDRNWSISAVVRTIAAAGTRRHLRAEAQSGIVPSAADDAVRHLLNQLHLLQEEHKRGDHDAFLNKWSALRAIQADVDF